MNITEIRVKMVGDGSDRLRAFCSVTFDGAFVVRDLKVIDGTSGPFVAMPSRKLSDRCVRCGNKNHLRAQFCNECGSKLDENRAPSDERGRIKLHADIAHPINAECRNLVEDAVIEAFEEELALSKQPGYKPEGGGFDDGDLLDDEPVSDGGFADGLEPPEAGTPRRDRTRQGDKNAFSSRKSTTKDSPVSVSSDRADDARPTRSSPPAEEHLPDDGFASGIL